MTQPATPCIIEFWNDGYYDTDIEIECGPEVADRFIIKDTQDLLKFMDRYVNEPLMEQIAAARREYRHSNVTFDMWLQQKYSLTTETLEKFSDPDLWRNSRFTSDYKNFCANVRAEFEGDTSRRAIEMEEFKRKMDEEILGETVSLDALEILFGGQSPFKSFSGNNIQGCFEVHYPTPLD